MQEAFLRYTKDHDNLHAPIHHPSKRGWGLQMARKISSGDTSLELLNSSSQPLRVQAGLKLETSRTSGSTAQALLGRGF
jgi:hypothetical protein